ncbi:MAG: glycosyltransferase [Isosphaeraceae bacterium]
MRTCVVYGESNVLTETFIKAHVELLPADPEITGFPPRAEGRLGLSSSLPARAWQRLTRKLSGQPWDWPAQVEAGYLALFLRHRPDVVLAEYGTTGAVVCEACRRAGIPLVVHFHGFDASERDVLESHSESYPRMFSQASALIGVSRAMVEQLIRLGAPPEKVAYNPYGVDIQRFRPGTPSQAEPTFLAVGRFVDKKAPHLTILAFQSVLRECPDARLTMIGRGPLLGVCRDLVGALGLDHAITFLGPQPPARIAEELRRARAFVQHSVQAESGDSEGTPVAVIEACAAGLPVVATRHGGIPDVVVDEETGFLVDERDVDGMASRMISLVRDPEAAESMGRAGRQRVESALTIEQSLLGLRTILEAAARGSHELPTFESHSLAADHACIG